MKALSAFVAVVLVCASVGRAADDDNAKKIIGKWEISKSEDLPAGTTVEFTKDGKVIATAKVEGKEVKLEGTYKVEKDKLTSKITVNGKTVEDTDDIVKLTDDTLELRDKDKKVTTLKKKK